MKKVEKVKVAQLPTMAKALVKACNVQEKEATKPKFRWLVRHTICK